MSANDANAVIELNELQMKCDNALAQVVEKDAEIAKMRSVAEDQQKILMERDWQILDLRIALAEATGSHAATQMQLYTPQRDALAHQYREKYQPKTPQG